MGIEDFNLDLSEHAERVLVLCGASSPVHKYSSLFKKRGYNSLYLTNIDNAVEATLRQFFDLIILDLTTLGVAPEQALEAIASDSCLNRSSLLVLLENTDASKPWAMNLGPEVQLLQTPFEPSALLVRVATSLRMRKLKTEQASFEAEIATQNAELRDLTNRFKHELKEARAIQQSILPKQLPSAPQTVFAASFEPLEAVGGDLFDIWKLRDETFGLFVADVTGHGLAAAFIGAMTKMAIAYASKKDPATMLSDANEGLAPLMPEGRFVTIIAAFYNANTGLLQVARGGHPPALLWQSEKQSVEQLAPRGLPLGVAAPAAYQLYETEVRPGDKLLLLTDGLTETFDMNGQLLGIENTAAVLSAAAAETGIDNCLRKLLDYQQQFAGGRIIKDDTTLLGLEMLR